MEPLIAYISRAALHANLAAIRNQVGPAVALCAMVKADAYGHGMVPVARTLAEAGAEMLAVARVEEAEALRRAGIAGPLLLLEPVADPGGDSYLADRLEAICRVAGVRATVADEAGAAALGLAAGRGGARVPVHVKVDTGMGRNGVLPEAAEAVARVVERSGGLQLEGVYTHLATADEADEAFARRQLAGFVALVEQWAARGRRVKYVHAANSAAAAKFARPELTLARPGIAVYGYQPGAPPAGGPLPLQPVLRLVARLALVKDLPAGHSVGYGCTWRTDRPTRIGLVPVGYGDGYSRVFGNRAVVQVAGHDVPVVGRVSMDLTTVDLTGLPGGGRDVRAGALVTVISEDRAAANSVERLAALAGTIPYEITCRLGLRVRRELVDFFPAGG